jgi:hypothetical protein
MKFVKRQKNIVNPRFAACTAGAALLFFFAEAARRATAGGFSGNFNFSTGGLFRDDFTPLMSQNILTRHEIFRGKISRRNNQKKHLDERTLRRQNP